MRAWRGIHRRVYRSAPASNSIVVAGSRTRTRTTTQGIVTRLRGTANGHLGVRRVLLPARFFPYITSLTRDRFTFSDFEMVIVDYVDRKQLFHDYPQVTPNRVLEEVPEALETPHENDLCSAVWDPQTFSLQVSTKFNLWILISVGKRREVSDRRQPCGYLMAEGSREGCTKSLLSPE